MHQLGKLVQQAIKQVSWNTLKGGVLALLALLLIGFLLLGTAAGRAWAAQQVLWWINQSTTWHIEVEQLQSHQLGHWEAERVRVYGADHNEPWLHLQGLEVQFPWQQSLQHWHLNTISIAQADVNLQPRDPASEAQSVPWPKPSLGRHLQLDQLNIATLNVRQFGRTLTGSVSANLDYPPAAILPNVTVSWQDQTVPASVTLSARSHAEEWLLTGEFEHAKPWSDSWQGPSEQPITGELALSVDVFEQRIKLNTLKIEGWFAPIELSAELHEQSGQWHIDPLRIQIDDQVSELTVQHSPSGMVLDSDWHLPLWLIMPWLPSGLATGWDDPNAALTAQVQFDTAADWRLAAQLKTTWQDNLATLSLAGFGEGWQVDDFLLALALDQSQLSVAGAWQPDAENNQLQIDGALSASLLQSLAGESSPESVTLKGQLDFQNAPTPLGLNLDALEAHWFLDTLAVAWSAEQLLTEPVHLTLSGSGQIQGNITRPSLNGQWRSELTTARDIVSLTIAESSFTPEAISLNGIQATWRDSFWAGQFGLSFAPDQPWQHWPIELIGSSFDLALADAYSVLNIELPVSGRWLGSHHGTGTLDDPQVQLMAHLNAHYAGQPLSGQLNWHNNTFSSRYHWQDASVVITAENHSGTWRPDQLDMTFSELPINLLWPELDLLGVVNGRAQLQSTQQDWVAELNLDLQGERQSDILSGQVGLTARGQALELNHIDLQRLSVGFGEAFAIAGQGGLNEEQWDLDLNWNGLSWTPPASWPLPEVPWRAQGTLNVSGEGDDPEIALAQTWRAQWTHADGVTVPWQFRQVIESHPGQYVLSNQLLAHNAEQLSITAQMPRISWLERATQPMSEWPWHLQAQWQTYLDDWLLWLDIDHFLAQGLLQGQGEWHGPLEDLTYEIDTHLQNGAMLLPILGIEASELNLQAQANQTHPLLVTGSGNFGDGKVTLTGELEVRDTPWRLHTEIALNQAMLLQRPEVQSAATGLLELSGHWPELTLSGDLALDELQLNLNRIAQSGIAQLDIHNEIQPEPVLWPLNIDIGVTTAGLARITGNGLDAQLSGDVRILGSPDAINTEGALTIESGQFNLLTRNFALTEGQLRLIDETIHLYIVAIHQSGDVTIVATLRGPLDALQLSLRSDPVLPEDEIVAQLLFGKAVQNMTPWQALQLASAINQLRGGDSLDLLLATRDTLGLDTLEIETGDEAETPAILRIGRYLNSRVYLELDTELSADRDLRGRVELELTPNLFLETQTGGGRSRLHLRWRRNY